MDIPAFWREKFISKKIKNIKSVLKNFVSSDKIPICKGKLIEGEIYISDIRAWWKKMNLRFRYEDSATLYPICYTSIPIKMIITISFTEIKRVKIYL